MFVTFYSSSRCETKFGGKTNSEIAEENKSFKNLSKEQKMGWSSVKMKRTMTRDTGNGIKKSRKEQK